MEEELRELERMEARKRAAAPAAAAGGGGGGGTSGVRTIRAGKDGADGGAPAYDLLIKLLMLGDSGVGKTTLLKRYAEGRFDSMIAATAGVAYETQYVEVEGRTIRVDIWDTAGQERFHVITQAYYAGAHGIVLAYDASEDGETSFNSEAAPPPEPRAARTRRRCSPPPPAPPLPHPPHPPQTSATG